MCRELLKLGGGAVDDNATCGDVSASQSWASLNRLFTSARTNACATQFERTWHPEPDPLAPRGEGAARGQTRRRTRQGVPAGGTAHRGRAQGAVQPDRAHRRRAGIGTAASGTVVR